MCAYLNMDFDAVRLLLTVYLASEVGWSSGKAKLDAMHFPECQQTGAEGLYKYHRLLRLTASSVSQLLERTSCLALTPLDTALT